MTLSAAEWEALALSARVALVSTLFCLPVGIALGWLLERRDFVGKILVEALVQLPMVLPPVVPGYLLLQLPRSFYPFFAVYLLVACGHGMFKPVVISTVVRSTTEKTGTLGFGIFYMMVNVGGLLGRLCAVVLHGGERQLDRFLAQLLGAFLHALGEKLGGVG